MHRFKLHEIGLSNDSNCKSIINENVAEAGHKKFRMGWVFYHEHKSRNAIVVIPSLFENSNIKYMAEHEMK